MYMNPNFSVSMLIFGFFEKFENDLKTQNIR